MFWWTLWSSYRTSWRLFNQIGSISSSNDDIKCSSSNVHSRWFCHVTIRKCLDKYCEYIGSTFGKNRRRKFDKQTFCPWKITRQNSFFRSIWFKTKRFWKNSTSRCTPKRIRILFRSFSEQVYHRYLYRLFVPDDWTKLIIERTLSIQLFILR